MAIGEAIKTARINKGYSRERLARKADIATVTLQGWEDGKSIPRSDLLIYVADALDITLDELVGRRVNK